MNKKLELHYNDQIDRRPLDMKNIFVQDLRKELVEFQHAHPNLSTDEHKILDQSLENLTQHNVSSSREKIELINQFRNLSLQKSLTPDGKSLLTKLQKSGWIWGLLLQTPFIK